MIPRIIHQLWINPKDGSAAGLPHGVRERCAEWGSLHPGFIHKIWSLSEVIELCRDTLGGRGVRAISDLRIPACQADLARLVLLREYGGFWTDLKLRAHGRFLDGLLNHNIVLTEHFAKDDLPAPNGFLINSFLGASPDNIFINVVLENVLRNVEMRLSAGAFHVTGPMVFNKFYPPLKARLNGAMMDYVIPCTQSWGRLFSTESGEYNDGDLHWSIREQREGMYVDH